MPAPKLPETRYDVAYLQAELAALRDAAERCGFGTLAYLIDCAHMEAGHQARIDREKRQDGERWEPSSD